MLSMHHRQSHIPASSSRDSISCITLFTLICPHFSTRSSTVFHDRQSWPILWICIGRTAYRRLRGRIVRHAFTRGANYFSLQTDALDNASLYSKIAHYRLCVFFFITAGYEISYLDIPTLTLHLPSLHIRGSSCWYSCIVSNTDQPFLLMISSRHRLLSVAGAQTGFAACSFPNFFFFPFVTYHDDYDSHLLYPPTLTPCCHVESAFWWGVSVMLFFLFERFFSIPTGGHRHCRFSFYSSSSSSSSSFI
jgi:hypothetical protein